jgi:hypothetical protein
MGAGASGRFGAREAGQVHAFRAGKATATPRALLLVPTEERAKQVRASTRSHGCYCVVIGKCSASMRRGSVILKLSPKYAHLPIASEFSRAIRKLTVGNS